MKIIKTISEIKKIPLDKKIALIPTMGAIHRGHLSLIEKAQAKNSFIIVSIFVNPIQFGNNDEYTNYPNSINSDIEILKKSKIDAVFIPEIKEIYPLGFTTNVDVGPISKVLEGKFRIGHFTGVATIITKLFSIIKPDYAYFGQKDAQQCLVIKKLNNELNLGVKIFINPTIRDQNGIAISSRNENLNKTHLKSAESLFKSLCLSKQLFEKGINNTKYIKDEMERVITKSKVTKIDYISIANANTLEELDEITLPTLISIAAWFGKTRLIDNILIK